jgi:hypothetical protein
MGVGYQSHALAAVPLGKEAGTRRTGGWVSHSVQELSPTSGFDPKTAQIAVSIPTEVSRNQPNVLLTYDHCPFVTLWIWKNVLYKLVT